MIPEPARDIMLFYTAFLLLALYFVLRRKGPKGMLLRMRGLSQSRPSGTLKGKTPPAKAFSHINPPSERPLNVVFNYNGHSWDAYEVLGLPAGSSPASVDEAFSKAMKTVDAESRPFLEAAYEAIQAEWQNFKASGSQ